MTKFYWECYGSSKELLRAVALGIGLDDQDFLLRFHSGENNQLRLLHYPPVETEKLSSNAMARMPAHSDWGSITMLFQDACGGLQVEDPKSPGTFVDATPIKNAAVVNVGDLLMRWSNGAFEPVPLTATAPAYLTSRTQHVPLFRTINILTLTRKIAWLYRLLKVDASPCHFAPAAERAAAGREGHDTRSLFDTLFCEPGSDIDY